MYFPDDIWREIQLFMFHNIKKHGKHLKNIKYNQNYNKVMKNIPPPYIPLTGPRIVYTNKHKHYRFVKFIYYCKFLDGRFHGSIIEYQLLPLDYDFDNKKNDSLIRSQYYSQFFKIKDTVFPLLTTS